MKEEEDGEPPIKKERKKSDEETITKTITITRKEKSGWLYLFDLQEQHRSRVLQPHCLGFSNVSQLFKYYLAVQKFPQTRRSG